MGASVPMLIAKHHWLKKNGGYLQDGLDKESFSTDRFLGDLYGKSQKLIYVSMLKALCIDSGCLGYVPGTQVLTSFDYGHLTPEGSIYTVSASLPESVLFAP
jgi:hypothetical protein